MINLSLWLANTILVLSRMFIWRQKFSTKRLDDANYFRFLRYELLSISFILQKEIHSECIPLSWARLFDFFSI